MFLREQGEVGRTRRLPKNTGGEALAKTVLFEN
jgi:hypothetical protein